MKKITIIFTLLVLFGCSAKREDFYNLKVGDSSYAVGFDESLEENKYINNYHFYEDETGNKSLDYLEIYIDDTNGEDIFIDDYKLEESIIDTCSNLNGELVNNNGNACILHKTVKNKENIIIMYIDILDDDETKIDRLEVIYK